MSWKKLTFIIIPHSKSGVKQISVPRVYVFGACIFMVLIIGVMFFYIMGFEGKEFYTKKTVEINKRNEVLEEQLALYDSILTVMGDRVDSLYTVNKDIPKQFSISERDLKLGAAKAFMTPESGPGFPIPGS